MKLPGKSILLLSLLGSIPAVGQIRVNAENEITAQVMCASRERLESMFTPESLAAIMELKDSELQKWQVDGGQEVTEAVEILRLNSRQLRYQDFLSKVDRAITVCKSWENVGPSYLNTVSNNGCVDSRGQKVDFSKIEAACKSLDAQNKANN